MGFILLFHPCTICEFYIPTFICGCDVIVILFFDIFCLQRVLGPLGANLGTFHTEGRPTLSVVSEGIYSVIVGLVLTRTHTKLAAVANEQD